VDLRKSRIIAKGNFTAISKEQNLGVRIVTDSGYLVSLNRMEASQIHTLFSNPKFKPRESEGGRD